MQNEPLEPLFTPEAIKAFRKRKGLTQIELGKLCGVGKSAVCLWESGESAPSGAAKLLLEDFLSGRRCIVPLTEQEERLLDEGVKRGNFADRADYLACAVGHLIMHGSFAVSPTIGQNTLRFFRGIENNQTGEITGPRSANMVAEEPPEYRVQRRSEETQAVEADPSQDVCITPASETPESGH